MSVIDFNKARKRLGKHSASKSQSTANTTSEETGQMFIEENDEMTNNQQNGLIVVYDLLFKVRIAPFTTKSNTAREAADVIGMLASDGLITTKLPDGTYVNIWMITENGMQFMEQVQNDFFSTKH